MEKKIMFINKFLLVNIDTITKDPNMKGCKVKTADTASYLIMP